MAIPGTESYYSYWKSKIDIYQVNMIRKNTKLNLYRQKSYHLG